MFVLRCLFWLTTLVILLPPSAEGGPPPRVNVMHAVLGAQILLKDATGACERNPVACAASREALALMARKLETGADIVVAGMGGSSDLEIEPAHGTLTQNRSASVLVALGRAAQPTIVGAFLPLAPSARAATYVRVVQTMTAAIHALVDDFALLDDWEDRYRYVIELGKTLAPLTEAEHSERNKVRGCASQVWLVAETSPDDPPILRFRGDSDAHIVRGLIAILLALYSGRSATEIAATDPEPVFRRIGLREHLTSQRSNGLSSMAQRIQAEARSMLAAPIT